MKKEELFLVVRDELAKFSAINKRDLTYMAGVIIDSILDKLIEDNIEISITVTDKK